MYPAPLGTAPFEVTPFGAVTDNGCQLVSLQKKACSFQEDYDDSWRHEEDDVDVPGPLDS